jgi:shikimate dehydrogenase
MKFAVIGKPIRHSFSPEYFTSKFRKNNIKASYEALQLEEIAGVKEIISKKELSGFNVTIPYKQSIIHYLDGIDITAAEINSVNTVKVENGKWHGYNTDWLGFMMSIQRLLKGNETALVFGSGGSTKAICYVLQKMGIPYTIVSRSNNKGMLNYQNLSDNLLSNTHLLINCTPLGMFPEVDTCIDINYACLNENHLCYDLVYNPEITRFMKNAQSQGAKVINGLKMLELQAEAAWDIWNT